MRFRPYFLQRHLNCIFESLVEFYDEFLDRVLYVPVILLPLAVDIVEESLYILYFLRIQRLQLHVKQMAEFRRELVVKVRFYHLYEVLSHEGKKLHPKAIMTIYTSFLEFLLLLNS